MTPKFVMVTETTVTVTVAQIWVSNAEMIAENTEHRRLWSSEVVTGGAERMAASVEAPSAPISLLLILRHG